MHLPQTPLLPAKVRTTNLGPFAELIRATGPLAFINPFRFSTKYQDDETGLLYYGYRWYQPSTGRWVSRDPLEEQGGINLFEYVNNNSINIYDVLGLNTVRFNLAFAYEKRDVSLDAKDVKDLIVHYENDFKEIISKCKALLKAKKQPCCNTKFTEDDLNKVNIEFAFITSLKIRPSVHKYWYFQNPFDPKYNFESKDDSDIISATMANIDNWSCFGGISTLVVERQMFHGSVGWLNGLADLGGIIIRNNKDNYVLPHELGHIMGYTDKGKNHSSKAGNLMHSPNGGEPDCTYCELLSKYETK